ncbi:MAG: hypothetical protein JWP89_715 [Schlesneria sp.]|nr:hypothetical protein [Schlesneria sp.]
MADKKVSPGSKNQLAHGWEKLTWDDLRAWAGSRDLEKGRSYTRRVSQLQITADGELLAWVTGTQRYVTTARLTEKRTPVSECSCPLQRDGCKHGVAVVIAYLEMLNQKKSVPIASADDKRWSVLLRQVETSDDEFDEDEGNEDDGAEFAAGDFDDDEVFEDDRYSAHPRRHPQKPATRKRLRPEKSGADLRDFLKSKPTNELIELLLDCAKRDPDFQAVLQEQQALSSGKVAKLVQAARREIDRATADPMWGDSWDDNCSSPDFGGVKRRLQSLLDAGYADEVVELGRDLLACGLEQVGEAQDEGETGEGLSDSLDVVFQALMKSSLPPHQKLLFTFEALMRDDYGVIDQVDFLIDHDWSRQDWSLVAAELGNQLQMIPISEAPDWTRSYVRDQLSNWLILALEKAGRTEEILPLCESEARTNGSYERLVKMLMDTNHWDDAERWAREGLANIPSGLRGIVHNLKKTLRDIAAQRQDWPRVAAFVADEFFEQPDVESFEQLVLAAQRAQCRDQVETAARRFLETGERPVAREDLSRNLPSGRPIRKATVTRSKTKSIGHKSKVPASNPAEQTLPSWPLPNLDLPEPRADSPRRSVAHASSQHHLRVLLDLALKAKQPEEILHWFDKWEMQKSGYGGWHNNDISDRVATAIASTHPERSLDLWNKLIDAEIAATSPAHYEVAAGYLRKSRDLLESLKRATEWQAYLARLRETHRRKRRLIEILDGLSGGSIVSE